MSDKVDAVIVGAGAAGSLMAARLAQAGKSVIVLEAGPAWEMHDLISSQIWARRLKWGAAQVDIRGDHRSFSHNLNTGSGFGGAALHHFATWPRMPEVAFRLKSELGRGRDWPFGYAELRPWYDKVQAEVGISGDAAAEPWRPPGDPYPQPPLKMFAHGKLLKRGFDALGLQVAPLPAGILTEWFGDRAPCQYDGWCEAGCPIGSLANPQATHMRTAREAGAKFKARSPVLRLLPGRGERAAGVEYADEKGTRHKQEADLVVVAASAIQTPRLLLASNGPRWAQGAGNGSGQVGRNFMLDAVASCFGMFAEETENHMGVPAGQLMHRSVYVDRPGGAFGSYQWQIGSSLKPNDIFGIAMSRVDLFGAPLDDFIRRGSKHLAMMGAMIEQLPDPANRIELAGDNDNLGMPRARVVHSFGSDTPALWRHCNEEGATVMRAAGAQETWSGPMASGHIAGGTPIGSDPASSVADEYGRLQEVPNVALTGAGLFPTTGGTSPTYTVLALAERTADHCLQNWAEIAA